MTLFCIYLGIYALGCFFTMVYFLVGRARLLSGRNWTWPIVFLWPLLVFWPVHALAGLFIKRKTGREK